MWTWGAPASAGRSRMPCARRSGSAGCPKGSGCRRRASWPPTSGFARNTVADAYGQLVAEGWLVARQGSGTRVARRVGPRDPHRHEQAGRPRLRATTCGRAARTSHPSPRPPGSARCVAPSRRHPWRCSATAIRGAGPSCGRPSPATSPALAASAPTPAASWSARVRAGARPALLGAGGTRGVDVAVEAHGLPSVRDVIRRAGLGVSHLAVDERGAVVEALTDQAAASC